MGKLFTFRSLVVLALAGSGIAAVALPGSVAAAKTKPPVTVTCTGLLSQTSSGEEYGCTGSAKSKVSAYSVEVPNGSDTAGTIYWTDKTTTTVSISYATGTFTCPNLGGDASVPGSPIAESSSVTGGNSKLTTGVATTTDACVYTIGSQILITNYGSYTLG